MTSGEMIDLALEGIDGADVFDRGIGGGLWRRGVNVTGRVLARGRNFAFDVL